MWIQADVNLKGVGKITTDRIIYHSTKDFKEFLKTEQHIKQLKSNIPSIC